MTVLRELGRYHHRRVVWLIQAGHRRKQRACGNLYFAQPQSADSISFKAGDDAVLMDMGNTITICNKRRKRQSGEDVITQRACFAESDIGTQENVRFEEKARVSELRNR